MFVIRERIYAHPIEYKDSLTYGILLTGKIMLSHYRPGQALTSAGG